MEKKKLVVFDFDGTLISSPLPIDGKIKYKEKTGKDWPYVGWWSKKESLDMDIFDMPLIEKTIEIYHKEFTPDALFVMLTGRTVKLEAEVMKIINSHSLFFHEHEFNYGGDTLSAKIKVLNLLLIEYPLIESIILNDDRKSHISTFIEYGSELIDKKRIKEFKMNIIQSDRF